MKFKRKPIVVDAEQLTEDNKYRALTFAASASSLGFDGDGKIILIIKTPGGTMTARLGDWIIKGVKGEFYPVTDDVFRATYEPLVVVGE